MNSKGQEGTHLWIQTGRSGPSKPPSMICIRYKNKERSYGPLSSLLSCASLLTPLFTPLSAAIESPCIKLWR